MKLRVASIAFLLAVMSTGASWLSLQPSLVSLIDFAQREAPLKALSVVTKVRVFLPFTMTLVVLTVAVLTFLIVHFTFGRPLEQTEKAIDQLSRLELGVNLEAGGPMLARLHRSLIRMAEALQTERSLTRRQLEELRDANEKLVRAQAELLANDRLATVGKLAAGVAHEVGNPLSGILGYLSVIGSRAKAQPELTELTQAIEAEVHRIDQIVRSLLDLGRQVRGKPGPVELAAVIRSSVKLMSKGSEMGEVAIKEELEPSLFVLAETGPLSQVVINLVLNAGQAMGGKGSITIRTRKESDHALLEVQDSGPGLSDEVKQRLFEPFFTTKGAGKGTGLGLAVSQHLVTTMGGKLRADNAAQGGAVFTLELPVPHKPGSP